MFTNMHFNSYILQVASNGPCSSCNMRGHVSFHVFVALSAISHKIDLENMSLLLIPFDLSLAVDAYRISLESNLIIELPGDWAPLVNLVELRLGHNKIENLPAGLSVLSTLLGLHVQNNRLTNIHVALVNLNRLRRLEAHGNPIEAIDVTFGHFWGQLEISIDSETLLYPPAEQLIKTGGSRGDILEVLDAWRRSRVTKALSLTHRSIREFPLISAWTTSDYLLLTSIDFSHNFIEVVPSWLGCMSELKILKLAGNPIHRISRNLAHALPGLVQFDVDWVNVEHSPGLPWIENGWIAIKKWWLFLQESSSRLQLESLDLENSDLHEVGLVCGSKLQSLHVKSCRMSAISSYWSLLTNLSTVDIENNPLITVESDPFQNMHLLGSCSICKCSVSKIKEDFFLSKWYLTSLNLSCNSLSMLPSSIGLATALTSINLDKNQLVSLPETWTSLRSLVICTIRKNYISSDLEALLKCQSNLRSLDLSYNRLQLFPCNPQNHTNLECLNVSHNMIVSTKHSNFSLLMKLKQFKVNDNSLHQPILELPAILENAKDLRCIDFSGNPMTFLPETCKKNAANMLILLRTLLSIVRTREVSADQDWDSVTLSFLLTRSDACILRATLQNVGLVQHPKELMLHDIVELDLSRNRIETISKELSQLTTLKSLNLSHNAIAVCKHDDVSLSLPYNLLQKMY